MFDGKKIEKERQELEKLKLELSLERQRLEVLKKVLEDAYPKIDISDVFVYSYGNISFFAKQIEIININPIGHQRYEKTYNIKLVDIFNHRILFEKISSEKIKRCEYVEFNSIYNGEDKYAYITPILEAIPELLVFADRKVPYYIFQQELCKINGLDVIENSFKFRN